MPLFPRTSGGSGGAPQVPTVVMLFLLAYFLGNVAMQLKSSYSGGGGDEGVRAASTGTCVPSAHSEQRPTHLDSKVSAEKQSCDTVEDFIEDGNYDNATQNPWRQMKLGLPPAKCRVNGHLIERLDPLYNYRRGVALRFTEDPDDKSHIEHWFLGTRVNFNLRPRRVLIDLGANFFETSVVWFNQRYPCDFTEVHAFEAEPNMFAMPTGFKEEGNEETVPGYPKIKSREGFLPSWMVERIVPHNQFAGDVDDKEKNVVNVTRFIKDELKLTEHDAVIVKMDIEGSEWPILQRWVDDPDMPKIIDELWVEVHYFHPDNNWMLFQGITRESATLILAEMRFKGFYVHYWD